MGCPPQDPPRPLSHTRPHHSHSANNPPPPPPPPMISHLQQSPGPSSSAPVFPLQTAPNLAYRRHFERGFPPSVAPRAAFCPPPQPQFPHPHPQDSFAPPSQHSTRFAPPSETVTSVTSHANVAVDLPSSFPWTTASDSRNPLPLERRLDRQGQGQASSFGRGGSGGPQQGLCGAGGIVSPSHYRPTPHPQGAKEPQRYFQPVEAGHYQQAAWHVSATSKAFSGAARTSTVTQQQQPFGRASEHGLLPTPSTSSFSGRGSDSQRHLLSEAATSASAAQSRHQAVYPSGPYRQATTFSPLPPPQQYQASPAPSPSAMLDKKPTLQVVTTDHSPISPGSSTSSPRFIFPDMVASSSSGQPGSDSGSSPFMSPVKREVKWEVGTPPHAVDVESHRERVRMPSGDTDPSETLVDSETGSSVLEDSSSSREQSPFSAMAESLSLRSPSEHSPLPLRSPSEHSPSPLARRVFHRQVVVAAASEDEEQGEESEGGGVASGSAPDSELHPPKFKKRWHERYVLSLKDVPAAMSRKVKIEAVDSSEQQREEGSEVEGQQSECKRSVAKIERCDSPHHPDSPMPKSPRRSSSDTDIGGRGGGGDGGEVGASSADESDVFMEPSLRSVRPPKAKPRPPSLRQQREPLDLSRANVYPGYRSSSGSASTPSPLVDGDPCGPSARLLSPVFRSPHRLPYSPHGLMSPQAQSPLCSVPEGGRIFNFSVPSPLEGPHSDSDLISPSPLSPRIFTFPPHSSVLNPLSEVNRLAVSPRAPYTPPPPLVHVSTVGGGGEGGVGGGASFYSKRSLSESDMSYVCPVCGQVFPTHDNLAKHLAKHLPTETVRLADANKIHYCKVCNRSFSRSDMLTRHMRLHTGLKPYECLECGQVFSRSDHLNTHRRTHTGEKPYRCPHCPYAACRRDMITRHMRTHAKRSSRRARYLSVPDDPSETAGSSSKPGGSLSSDSAVEVAGPTCSVSSVDSMESESARRTYTTPTSTASADSLLSPSSPSFSRKPSEEEGLGEGGAEAEAGFERFLQYRKGRNWSTASLESVDSEEALFLRETLVDDAFHDPDTPTYSQGAPTSAWDSRGVKVEQLSPSPLAKAKDVLGLETKTFQKCFISPQAPGGSGSS